MEVKLWAQMFFEDGSITQGVRISAEWLDESHEPMLRSVAENLLKSVNRQEGWILLWGAGNMELKHYPTSFSSKALESNS